MSNQTERLSIWSKLAYASPALPIACMGVPIAVYIPQFYAQDLGLSLAVVGMVFMMARMWDVVTDPLLGVMSDRFPSRWGRRRHWLVLSVPIMMFSSWKIFMPDPEQVSALYLGFWLFIMYIGWTLLSLTHQAWGAEITPDYNERTHVSGVREIFLIVGSIVVLALPSVIEQIETDNVAMDRMAAMGWMLIIFLPLTVFWAVTKVGERDIVAESRISWKETFSVLKGNGGLQRILLTQLVVGLSNAITASLFLFLSTDILKLGNWSSLILLLYFISGIFYVPVFNKLSAKIGKHMALCLCASLYVLGANSLWFIPEGSVIATAVVMCILGMQSGTPGFLLRSMLGDVVDEDTVKTHKQRTGLFFSLYNMIEKMGGAMGVGLTFLVLDLMGFVPGGENTDAAIFGFELLFVVPALLFNALIAFIAYRFPLDKVRQERNRKILEERQQSQAKTAKEDDVQADLSPA